MQEIAKLMYFLTGASTERQAVIAYNKINNGMKELGETAISETIITPIRQQEPGHFALPDVCYRDDPGQGAAALAAVFDEGDAGRSPIT